MKIVFLNGPPRSGKDTIAKYLDARFKYHHTKFAKALKEGAHNLVGLKYSPHDAFEDTKDMPMEEFFGYSPRQFYIDVSEKFMKPQFGSQIYGTLLVRELEAVAAKNVAISDCGFYSEILPIMKKYAGVANTTLVRIHREGCNFSKDSRSYIEDPSSVGIKFDRIFDFENNGTINDLETWAAHNLT